MLTQLSHWLSQHAALLGVLAGISVILLLGSVVATPWVVSRLPEDYLLQRQRPAVARSALNTIAQALRTLIGVLLILLGLTMLIIPGPGLVTLLVGISIARFPGKHRLLRYVASREAVYGSLNWMRQRHQKPLLLHPFHDDNGGKDT